MGYFANGTEGDKYVEKYCDRCIHWTVDGIAVCPVWDVHLKHNYDQQKNPELKNTLELLIPREGIWNGQCRMFIPESP